MFADSLCFKHNPFIEVSIEDLIFLLQRNSFFFLVV